MATVKPNSIPIGGYGQKSQSACDPILSVVGAYGDTYIISGAVSIHIAPNPEQPVYQTGTESNTAPEPVEK